MAATEDLEQKLLDLQREYLDFLDDEEDQGKYTQLVKNMLNDGKQRLVVNINDLRHKNPVRAQGLLSNAFEEQLAFQRALKDFTMSFPKEKSAEKVEEYFVAFEGSFGKNHVTPRTLHSRHLGNLICVEGIVTKCSLVYPKVVRSVHYCPATKKFMERKYTDLTSLEAVPTAAVYPTKDDEGNTLETEFGLSTYKDHQTISIQEMPEKAPAGQLPRSVDIICDNDLVDRCKPGDRIQVVGNFRCLPNKQGAYTNGTFKTIVIANNITELSKDSTTTISSADIADCRNLARNHKNVFNLLSKSLAPSIHGHDFIKKAILCLLLGGVEKVLPNGTRLRGDINVLLIGDPSVAKSQLLRYVLSTAPRAIPTTGRGSSGVGLTAAVTTDADTGERRLEAGAMVLADRGVVCIDEFDKMSDIDRTAIHEVMEQGRVTIAKAGIHASLNARCSVLAAANPVYGKYDQYKTPMENIGLQDSLLSRFDLLFVMLDAIDNENDGHIADHVLRMHRYRSAREQDGEVLATDSAADQLSTANPDLADVGQQETPMYEKYDALLHGNSRKKSDKILSVDFMRKYIHFVKILKPVLTDKASEIIADEYSKLRSEDLLENDVARTQPVTARTLETMIRLATAHAKARMSAKVTEKDAKAAIELVHFAYFKKVLEKKKKSRKRRADSAGSDSESDDDDDNDDDHHQDGDRNERAAKRSRRHSVTTSSGATDMESEGQTASSQVSQQRQETGDDGSQIEEDEMEVDENFQISQDRLSTFMSSLYKAFRETGREALSLSRVREHVNSSKNPAPFSQQEINSAINKMAEDNKIMVADGVIILI